MINTITIDIETLDMTPSAVILSIGGFGFDVTNVAETRAAILKVTRDPELAEYSEQAFYGVVETFDQLMMCRTVSSETQQWWYKRGLAARSAFDALREPLETQLLNLSKWISQHREAQLFFRGTDFDGSILEHAYQSCSIQCPWKYNQKRDVRTYIDAMTRDKRGYIKDHQPCFAVIKHHALHDAMSDAEQMAVAHQQCALGVRYAQ